MNFEIIFQKQKILDKLLSASKKPNYTDLKRETALKSDYIGHYFRNYGVVQRLLLFHKILHS